MEQNLQVTLCLDINLGCPIDLVYKRGMGSGLMGRKKPLEVMIKSMTRVLSRPLTLKMRTGVYSDKNIAHQLVTNARDWGVDLVTIHGRSREQVCRIKTVATSTSLLHR